MISGSWWESCKLLCKSNREEILIAPMRQFLFSLGKGRKIYYMNSMFDLKHKAKTKLVAELVGK